MYGFHNTKTRKFKENRKANSERYSYIQTCDLGSDHLFSRLLGSRFQTDLSVPYNVNEL